jgi:dihydroorotase
VASHHVPLSVVDKDVEFNDAAFGISAIETYVATAYDSLVAEAGMSAADFVRLISTGPAKLFGLAGGTLAVGAPADVAVLDVETAAAVTATSFFSRGKNTPFEGVEVGGKPALTVVGGVVVMRGGNCASPPNPALAA